MPEEDKNGISVHNNRYLFLIVLILFGYQAKANPKNSLFINEPEKIDSTITDSSSSNMHFIALSTIISTNNVETGWHEIRQKPQTLTGILYYSPVGVYINADYNRYYNTYTLSHGLNLDIGYSFYKKDWSLDLNFNKNFFKGDTLIKDYIYSQAITGRYERTWNNYAIALNSSWVLDKQNDFMLSIDNTLYYEFASLFDQKDFLTFEPSLNFNYGTENWLIHSEIFDLLLRGSILDRSDFKHKEFSFLGYDIYVPLTYSINNLSIAGQFLYYIPSKRYRDLGIGNQHAFVISCSYIFDL